MAGHAEREPCNVERRGSELLLGAANDNQQILLDLEDRGRERQRLIEREEPAEDNQAAPVLFADQERKGRMRVAWEIAGDGRRNLLHDQIHALDRWKAAWVRVQEDFGGDKGDLHDNKEGAELDFSAAGIRYNKSSN